MNPICLLVSTVLRGDALCPVPRTILDIERPKCQKNAAERLLPFLTLSNRDYNRMRLLRLPYN